MYAQTAPPITTSIRRMLCQHSSSTHAGLFGIVNHSHIITVAVNYEYEQAHEKNQISAKHLNCASRSAV